jgi:oligoribonuclease NrnB/cAMP/cGMP phosphodiesterase (DHH superfamily)
MNLENTILVTHKGCMDGSGCAVLFLVAGGKKENIIYVSVSHNQLERTVEKLIDSKQFIIFADCSVPMNLAEKLNTRGNVILLDHHKTAASLDDNFDWCWVDDANNACGSKMLYNWLLKDCSIVNEKINYLKRYEQLITYIDDYDRWVHHYEYSKNLLILHNFYGQEQFVDRFVNNYNFNNYINENFIIRIEKKKEEDYIRSKIDNCQFKVLDGTRFAFVEADNHQSKLGHTIIDKYDVDIAVMIGVKSISLRSREGVDCSFIAKLNGGGGHLGAAGFNTKNILGDTLIHLVKKNIKVEEF